MQHRLLWFLLLLLLLCLSCSPYFITITTATVEQRHGIKINTQSFAKSNTYYPTTSSSQHSRGRAAWQSTPPHIPTPSIPAAPIIAHSPAAFTLPPALIDTFHVRDREAGSNVGPAVLQPNQQGEQEEQDGRFDALYQQSIWRRLEGECFTRDIGTYAYHLCPFFNVTQRSHFLPVHVSLGVWKDWNITQQGEFAMEYKHGTQCQDNKERITTVIIHCSTHIEETNMRIQELKATGVPHLEDESSAAHSYSLSHSLSAAVTGITAVEEPIMCEYTMHFATPLVCSLYMRVRRERRWRQIQPEWAEAQQTNNQYEIANTTRLLHAKDLPAMLRCLDAMAAVNATASSYRAACLGYL